MFLLQVQHDNYINIYFSNYINNFIVLYKRRKAESMYKTEIKEIKYKFARNLAKIRKSKNLTQENLAELIGVYREHIAKVETGKRNLSFDKIILTSIVLKIELKDLFKF